MGKDWRRWAGPLLPAAALVASAACAPSAAVEGNAMAGGLPAGCSLVSSGDTTYMVGVKEWAKGGVSDWSMEEHDDIVRRQCHLFDSAGHDVLTTVSSLPDLHHPPAGLCAPAGSTPLRSPLDAAEVCRYQGGGATTVVVHSGAVAIAVRVADAHAEADAQALAHHALTHV